MPQDCMFCKLIQSDQILNVFENEYFVAFLDINPRAKGHTMIVPKQHFSAVTDFPPEIHAAFTAAIQAVTHKLQAALDADGVSYVMNEGGEVAGQRIPHTYLQVFPRYESDENAGAPAGAVFQPIEMSEDQLRQLQQEISNVPANIEQGGELETREKDSGEEVVVDSPGDKLREDTDHQRTARKGEKKDLSAIQNIAETAKQSESEDAREGKPQQAESQQDAAAGSGARQGQSPAEEEDVRQKQPRQQQQARGGGPSSGGSARFSTSEEFDEEYPEMSDIRVEKGVDLDQYAPKDLEIRARVFDNYTLVDFREKHHATQFSLDGVTRERNVVHAVAKYFKLDPELVADRIEFEYQDFTDESLDPRAGNRRYDPDQHNHSLSGGGDANSPHDRAEFI